MVKKKKDALRRKKLHWNAQEDVDEDSVWGQIQDLDTNLDMSELDDLFTAKNTSPKQRRGTAATKAKRRKSVQLLDMKRATNMAIAIARIKMPNPNGWVRRRVSCVALVVRWCVSTGKARCRCRTRRCERRSLS